MRRLDRGVPAIRADSPEDLQRGLGFLHATDRLMQMLVTRIVGRGELTKYFLNNEEGYAVDFSCVSWDLEKDILQDLQKLTPEALQWTHAYCEGVNAFLESERFPLLCRIFGVKKEPWHLTDAMLIVKTLFLSRHCSAARKN